MSPARTLAFEVLLAVEHRKAWAADMLSARGRNLDSRDAGLAALIVLGALRCQAQLDYLLGRYAGRPASRLDPEVRIILRMGIYQLRYLDRVPAHAAVSESVDLVKRARKRSATGMVNAVLRKVDRAAVAWPDRATELSTPAWMLERWDRQYGPGTVDHIAKAALAPPETYIRVPAGAAPPQQAVATAIPGCFRLPQGEPGAYRVQDIGSQSIVPLLALEAGHTFLDLCAAPGNKTAQALEAGVRAVACDIHLRRLAGLGALAIDLVVLDGTEPLPFRRSFDRILVDAPCSGTGTLGRNPEIKWRLKPQNIAVLHRIQVALLAQAHEALAPGGRLVYSTCSLEPEENQDVIATLPPRVVLETIERLPGRDAGDGFFAAVIKSD